MKKLVIFTLMVTCFAKGKDLDSIVAVINDEVITKSDIDFALQQEKSLNYNISSKDQEKKIINFLIDESILVQHAKNMGIKVDVSDVDQMYMSFVSRNNHNEKAFAEILTSQGQSVDSFKGKLKRQILAMRVQSLLLDNDKKPTAKQVESFWLQHRYDNIMLEFEDSVYQKDKLVKVNKIPMTLVKSLPKTYQAAIFDKIFQKKYGPIYTESGKHYVKVSSWQGQEIPKGYFFNMLFIKAIEANKANVIKKLKPNFYIKVSYK